MTEVARAFADALAGGGALAPHFADEIVMHGTVGGLDEELVLRGRDAVVAYFNEILEPWDRLDVEIERVAERDDVFVVLMRETGQNARTSIGLSRETALVARVVDGAIVELRGYLDQAAALKTAGLD